MLAIQSKLILSFHCLTTCEASRPGVGRTETALAQRKREVMRQATRNIARANHNVTTALTTAAVPTVALLILDLCLLTAVASGFATVAFVPW